MRNGDILNNDIMNYLTFILLVTCLLAVPPVQAQLENDHRYQVRGYVLDENESPIAGSPVSIQLDGSVIGTGTTNSSGYYRISLHLHDSDLGRRLRVRTAAGEATVTVTFTPGDKVTVRRHYANFIGGKLIEERLFWRELASWWYIALAVAVVVTLAGVFRRPLKKILKSRRKPAVSAVQRTASKKGKKRRKRRSA